MNVLTVGYASPNDPGGCYSWKYVYPEDEIKWEEINRKYLKFGPNITQARPEDVSPDAEDWNGVPHKYPRICSEKP